MNKGMKLLLICITVLFACSSMTVYAVSLRYALGFEWPSVPHTIEWYCDGLESWQETQAEAAMTKWSYVQADDGSELLNSVLTNDSTSQCRIYFDYLPTGTIARITPNPDLGDLQYVWIRLSNSHTFSDSAQVGAYDLQSVILHELGHAYGVAHCHNDVNIVACGVGSCPYNVMSPVLSSNSQQRVLKNYDKDSYRSIYA